MHLEGMLCLHTLQKDSYSFFVGKFWGYIGDFYEKSPMQVRTESATFPYFTYSNSKS